MGTGEGAADFTRVTDDFTAVTDFTITIAADTQSQTGTFDFTPTNDLVYEGNETVTVSGAATGLTVEPATLTITDNETAPTTINLTLSPSAVGEEAGETTVTVTAAWMGTTPIEEATAVTVSVAAGTGEGAAEADDFTAVTDFTITIGGGSPNQTGTFDFTPTSDLVYEGNERVTVSGTSSGLTVNSADLTITDNDVGDIKLTLSPSAVGEEDGLTTVTVTATWDGTPSSAATDVTVSVDALTAETDDFTAVTDFTITIAADTQSQTGTFDFAPTNDLVYESNETVTVSGAATGLTVEPATLTITDNETAPTTINLTLSPSAVGEEAGETTVTVTAAWMGTTPIEEATAVTVSVAAGTGEGAAEADDFTAVTDFTITIGGGSPNQTGTFDFTPTSDLVYEGDERVTVSGTSSGLTVNSADRITDNDVTDASPSAVGEFGGSVAVGTGEGAAETDDFTAVTDFTITIAADTQSQTGDDADHRQRRRGRSNETVTVSGAATGLS